VTRGGDGGRETAQKSRTVQFWRRRGRENCAEPFWGRNTVFPASWRAAPTSSGGDGRSTRCVRATHTCWAAGAGWARWREAWAERGVARASWARVARGVELGWQGVARASWARRAAGSWAGTVGELGWRSRGPRGGEGWRGLNGGKRGGRRGRLGRLKWAREGRLGHFTFFFCCSNCFPFSFYLLHLIQIQICHKFKLAPSSICIKQK
jgi:hypothetical protein